MIEKKDVKDFIVFVKAVCSATSFCGRCPSSCRLCLEENKVGILLRERWSYRTQVRSERNIIEQALRIEVE